MSSLEGPKLKKKNKKKKILILKTLSTLQISNHGSLDQRHTNLRVGYQGYIALDYSRNPG